jgi:hypothetical protein
MTTLRQGVAVLAVWLTLMGYASAATFWGLTTDQHLVRFTSSAPGTILANLPVTGLPAGEHLVGIQMLDDGRFVGVVSSGHVYSLDRRTGAATLLPSTGNVVAPSGNVFGLTEWNNSLVLASDTNSILIINESTWGGGTLAPWSPAGHWAALSWWYDAAAVQWHVFLLDSNADTLSTKFPDTPEPTAVTTVGPLGVDASDIAGMDADPHDNVLYAALTVGGTPGLYTIDQSTGHATLIGAIGSVPIASLTLDRQGLPIITQVTPPPPGARGSLFAVLESNVTLEFSVTRTGDDTVAADYFWRAPASLVVSNAFATPGQDYIDPMQIVHFEPGETTRRVSIQILDDTARESQEEFQLQFGENVPNGAVARQSFVIFDDDNKPPVLTITSPALLGITTTGNTASFAGTTSDDEPGVTVTLRDFSFPGIYPPPYTTTANPWSFTDIPVQRHGRNTFVITATDAHFASVSITIDVWQIDQAEQTFVFAEGATGGFFTTELLFANPNFVEVPIAIDFMREDGTVIPYATTLPPARRVTLNVASIPGLEATATSAIVHTTSFPIVVERTMRWDRSGYGASGEKGATALSTTWLFAEGSQGFFKTFLLPVNPQATSNDVTVRFLRESGTPVVKTYTMSPHQRLTVDGAAIPELQNQSFGIEVTFAQPGAAERSMYFGDNPLWTGGHESAGAPAASTDWFLAEGATGPFFETFLLLANPSSDPAEVTLTYLPNTGVPVTRTKQVPANGRLTVNIELEDPSLANVGVATRVSSATPIVVERSQYWPYTPDQWYEAHNSFGLTAPATHWGLAEGRVGGPEGYQTFILLANPQTTATDVTVHFIREDGGPVVTKTYTIPPTTRFTLSVDDVTVPEIANASFGADIIASVPIMVERSMYSNAIGQLWAAGTNATATRLP